jgi:hypothetical protein
MTPAVPFQPPAASAALPAADLAAIVDGVDGDPYDYDEVIEGGAGEPAPVLMHV